MEEVGASFGYTDNLSGGVPAVAKIVDITIECKGCPELSPIRLAFAACANGMLVRMSRRFNAGRSYSYVWIDRLEKPTHSSAKIFFAFAKECGLSRSKVKEIIEREKPAQP